MKPNFFPSARSLCSLLVAAAFCTIASAQAADSSEITQLLKQNQPAQALARIDSLLTFSPKDPQLHFLKGVAQAMSDKTQEAINTFTQLTQEYPDLPEPYNNLAVLYANQNQLDKSRQALEQAIRTNPSYSTAHENLGDIYAKMASQAYNKALQLEGSNANSLKPKLSLIHDLFSVAPGAAAVAAATATSSTSSRPTVAVAAASTEADSNSRDSAQAATPAPAPKPQPQPQPAVAPSTSASTPVASPPTVAPPPPPPPVAPQVAPAAPIVSPSATPTPPTTTGNAGNTANIAANTATANTATANTTATDTSTDSSRPAASASAASAATKPSPVAEPTPTPAASTAEQERAAEQAVQAWAKAWAAQDMKAYLGAYGPSFNPGAGKSRAAWEKERHARIVGKKNISVTLSNLRVSIDGKGQAQVRFQQTYRADSFQANTGKLLVLEQRQGRWLITRESVSQ